MPTTTTLTKKTNDSVELEVLEMHEETDDEEQQQLPSLNKEQTGPFALTKQLRKSGKSYRNGRRVKIKKTQSSSCGSLYNVPNPSYKKHQNKSEPNVNMNECERDGVDGGSVNLNLNINYNYNNNNTVDTDGELKSNRDDTSKSVSFENFKADDTTYDDDNDVDNFNGDCGGKSAPEHVVTYGKTVGRDNGSRIDDDESHRNVGFKTSVMNILNRFGIWRQNDCKLTIVPTQHSSRSPLDKGSQTTSKARQYIRGFSFGANERRIRANDRAYNSQFKYANNYIKTSKYSLLTFLPLNLLEQFQRIANFYFLCLLVLQLIPAISSLTPITTVIPLIGVLMLTAIKDAYDDIQRHISDSQVNNRRSKCLRLGKLVDEKWSGVQVGDIIRMDNNQFVAADILLLSSSEPNGLCFIETAELDGETNLKCKQCLTETADMGQRDDLLWKFNGEIVCEPPNNLLNKFDGTLFWRNQRYSLDNDRILLRGCIIRNTQWCYGVVVFAGKDTKLMQNSGKTKFKRTTIDRLLNFIIIGIVVFLFSICAFCTLACSIWEGLTGQHFTVYLPWEKLIPSGTIQGATVIGLLVFFSYAIVLNTVVPISLYVSVEVIRFAQSFLINWDEKMYHEPTKTSAKARTTTLNEELGQIQYIFSDKTGTLTKNIMTFNKCSINGRSYGDIVDYRTGEVIEISEPTSNQTLLLNDECCSGSQMKSTTMLHSQNLQSPTATLKKPISTLSSITTLKPTIIIKNDSRKPEQPNVVILNKEIEQKILHTDNGQKRINNQHQSKWNQDVKQPLELNNPVKTHGQLSQIKTTSNVTFKTASNVTFNTNLNSSTSSFLSNGFIVQDEVHDNDYHESDPVDFSSNPDYEPDFKWYDQSLQDAVRSDEEHVHNFFRLLALCHTVMPENKNGRLEYQAQSPDESALVSAARNFGFVFRSRTPNSITIDVMGRQEEYELLSILDFNNVRKRMSVILRRNNKILLYCKGADNVIYERLSSDQFEIKSKTQEHLNKFAGEGLRTLALAERYLDEGFFNEWRERQQEAALSLDGREDKLGAIYEEIECEMSLVGVTAIEDKLQDGVPQAISNLQMAGIRVWVLTGDKQETALNIGYSCQLLTDDLVDVFIVDGMSMIEVEQQLRKFKESIKIVNTYHPTSLKNGETPANTTNSDTLVPPPSISVVTFSAECNKMYDGVEKGEQQSATVNIESLGGSGVSCGTDMEENSGFAMVVNGHSLVHCLSPQLEEKFLDIASNCKSVICCRVTPLQKAMVVELIKRSKNAVTLAIGDGANDVSMIKAAHIGVGISGQEGMQAVLASDYSIAQFKYLERLLLVHGRWSYYRMCKFLRYFFYKNFAFTLCHFWFAFFCGFSAQTVFDPMFISVYNLFYTSLPVLALGVFEQDVSDKSSIEFPKLYTPGLTNALFNTREFIKSVFHGIFSSLVLFLIPYGTYKDGVSPDGYVLSDHMLLGSVVATILILDNTSQIALDTSYWTIFNHIMIWGSLLSYFFLDYFYNYVIGGPYVGSLTQAVKEATFWFTTVLTVVVLMVPVLASRFYFFDVFPSLSDKIRLKQRLAQIRSRQSTDVLRTPSARRARRSLRSGYAFAHQEGFGRLITSGKIMRKLPQDFAFPLGLGSKNKHNSETLTKSHTLSHNNNNLPGSSNGGDQSPRAPCQDLDTINL